MDQEALIARVAEALKPDERVRALFVSGSFGRGTADRYSDVDLLAILEPAEREAFAAQWFDRLDAIMPLVFRNRQILSAYVSASSDPDSYGKITVLQLPPDTQTLGPQQVQTQLVGRVPRRQRVQHHQQQVRLPRA